MDMPAEDAFQPAAGSRPSQPGAWITVFGLVLFAAGIPLLPTIQAKVDASLLAGVILLLGLYIRWRAGALSSTPLDVPALALLGTAAGATIVSVDPFGSFFPSALRGEGFLTFAAYIAALASAARLNRKDIQTLIASVLISGSLISAIALAQYYGVAVNARLGIDEPVAHYGRTPGTLGHAFFLGGYLALVLPVGVAVALAGRGRTWWLSGGASLMLCAALVASQTRIAWAGIVGATALLTRLLAWVPGAARRLVLLAGAAAVITAVLIVTNPQVSLGRRAASALDVHDSSLQQRLYVWKHTLPMIAQRPLLGWGFGALLGRFPDIGSPEWVRLFGFGPGGIDTPHTETLHIAFSIGVIGLAAYLWIWMRAIAALWPARRGGDATSALQAGLLASLAAYGLWLQFGWTHMGPANVFWVLAGVAVALRQ